jgi:hypothetical protein
MLGLFGSLKKFEDPQIKRDTLTQPHRSLRVISFLLASCCVWMDENVQRTTVDEQPGNEGTELGRSEEVDFEHGDGVWADWAIEDSINAEFWDCNSQGLAFSFRFQLLSY